MAYNIVLKSPQEFTPSATNDFYYQYWKTDPEGPLYIKHFIGSPAPAPILINFQIENHFVTSPPGKYTQFYVNARIIAWTGPYANLNLSGAIDAGEPGIMLTESNLQQSTSLSFQNMGLLSPGKVNGLLEFYVNGVRADSGLTDRIISTVRIYVEIEVLEQTGLSVTENSLVLTHVKAAVPLAGRTFNILASGDFRITIPDVFDVAGGNIIYSGAVSGARKQYTGTGSQVVTVSMNADFDLYAGSVLNAFLYIQNLELVPGEIAVMPTAIKLTAYLFDADGFFVDPEALSFFSIKGVEQAAAQSIEIVSTQDFTVSKPYWLNVSPVLGSISLSLNVIPVSSNNLVPGEYLDVIILTSANAILEIPVSLKVVESINIGFSVSEVNFTGENKDYSTLYSADVDQRASLEVEITSYDYKGFGITSSHPFKRSFFDAATKIHIGEIVARKFKKLESLETVGIALPQFKIFNYFRPASVDIVLNIESRKTGTSSSNKQFNNVQYLPGRKPKQFESNYGILNFETAPIRVTRKSQQLFNFFRKNIDHEIKIYRNNEIYKTLLHSPGTNSVFGMMLLFNDFTPGDIIDIRLAKNEVDFFVQQYVVFPDQAHSNHLFYMGENNVLEIFECTGALSFTSEYDNISRVTYTELVERIENLETNKEQKLLINTGWILKSNQSIVDAIIRSRRLWFVNGTKIISLTSLSKQLVNEDSDQELYEYDLEFIINRENNGEVYVS